MEATKTPSSTPEALLERWRRRRDPEALGALFDATAPALFRVALGILGDPNQAEDALQETFLTLLESAEGHDGRRPVTPWLIGILRNHARALRRRRARAPDPRRLGARRKGAPPQDASGRAAGDRVRQALDRLSEPYRTVGLLHWCYGLSPAEIAQLRGEPPGTTRSTLSRARQRLRDRHPAGAVLLGLGAMPRGFAVLRGEILRHAGTAAASAAASPLVVLLGGLAVKKILFGAAAVVALALLAWVGPWRDADDASSEDASDVVADAPGAPPAPIEDAPVLAGRSEAPGDEPLPVLHEHAVRGIVVDGTGAPVAGARVFAVPADHPAEGLETADVLDVSSGGSRSDARGRFEVEVPEGLLGVDLQVIAAGFAPELTRDVRVGEHVRVVLDRPAWLSGRVLDVEERPVSGALVRVRGLLGALPFEYEVRVGDDGAYRIEIPLSPAEVLSLRGFPLAWHLEVEADGFAPLVRSGPWLAGAWRARPGRTYARDLVLVRGATLAGRVLEAGEERPVPHAQVAVWTHAGQLSVSFGDGRRVVLADGLRLLGRTSTDDEGRFEIRGLPARGVDSVGSGGSLGFAACWKEGLATAGTRLPTPEDGERLEHDFVLRPTGRIEGRVLGPDGGPGPACRVVAYVEAPPNFSEAFVGPPPAAGAPSASARTDANGAYALPAAPAGVGESVPVTVLVNPLGPTGGFTFERRSVHLRAGDVVTAPDVTIGIPDAAYVHARVRVLDSHGVPLRGAEVARDLTSTMAWSDDQGLVRLRWSRSSGVNPPEALLVRARGHAPLPIAVRYTEGDPETTEVRLEPGHVLRGRVLRADRTPAPSVRVTVADGRLPVDRVLTGQPFAPGGLAAGDPPTLGVLGRALTEEDGSFRIRDLPTGPYHVEVVAKRELRGVRPAPAPLRLVKTDVAGAEHELELVLPEDDAPPVGRVEGRATDENGRGPHGASAWLERGREAVTADRVGPGRFVMPAAPEGAWILRVEARGCVPYRQAGFEVEAGRTTSFDVVLDRGVAVEGKALDAEGKPLLQHEVGFSPVPSRGLRRRLVLAAVQPDGSFRATGLEPGVWRLAAAPRGQFHARASAAVPQGNPLLLIPPAEDTVRYDRPFVAAGSLSIAVGGERWPMPAGFAEPTAEQTAFGRASRIVVLDASGRVLVDHRDLYGGGYVGEASRLAVEPGTYVIRLETPAGETERRVEVGSGRRARVYFGGE